jgi:hypothetical protein
VVEELDPFLSHHVEHAANSEDLRGLRRSGSSAYDQLARREALDLAEDGPEGVGLGYAGYVVFGGPGLVGLHRDELVPDQLLERDMAQCRANGVLDSFQVLSDGDCGH